MRLTIRGRRLPGRADGPWSDAHVGLQVGRDAVGLVRADADEAVWRTEVETAGGDQRGPAVHGRRGERFLYLTWGTVDGGGFAMVQRAKLLLADLPLDAGDVTVEVDLTDDAGRPVSGRLRPSSFRVVQP